MNDDFIRGLKSDWQSQHIDSGRVLARLRRRRWVPHAVLGAEIIVCILAFAVGLWFAWVSTHGAQHRLLFALSAAILLLMAPALGAAAVLARRASLAWDAETPESLLATGIRRAESSLRAIRIGRWHIAVVAAFVIALWALTALGLIQAIDFLVLYTAVCFGVCVAGWAWMAWREKRARSEIAACAQLLQALEVDPPALSSRS